MTGHLTRILATSVLTATLAGSIATPSQAMPLPVTSVHEIAGAAPTEQVRWWGGWGGFRETRLRLGRLRRGLAQTLLWRRGPRGGSHRRASAWVARGQRRILLWLRLSVLLWLRVRLLPVLLRLSGVQLRLLPGFLRLPVLLLLPELLRSLLLRILVWLGLRERLLDFGQARPKAQVRAARALTSLRATNSG